MGRKTGQIIARGQSTWLVRIYQGRDPQTGTRKYHNQTIRGPFREAQRFLNLKLQQRDPGRALRAAAITLNQFLDQWLAMVARPRLRARTFHDYESLLRLYIRPALGTRLIGAIEQMDVQELYAQMFERGLSARTIEYTNAVLESAFRQAVRWRMLAENPCAGVDLPRTKRREMNALSVEECRRFLSVAENRNGIRCLRWPSPPGCDRANTWHSSGPISIGSAVPPAFRGRFRCPDRHGHSMTRSVSAADES
jgi:integrase